MIRLAKILTITLAMVVGINSWAAPQQVRVGTYLVNVESLDLANNNYYLSFFIWFKWKGSVDPSKSFIFLNMIDEWGLTKTPVYKKPIKTSDGYFYQRFRIEGRFVHKFWLGTFPLDWQKVTFEIRDSSLGKDKLVYVPDEANSGVNPDLAIPGWKIQKTYNEQKVLDYETNFGEGGQSKKYSRYRFGLKIQRPGSFYLFKVIPPVFITLLCCFLIFLLDVAYVDARVSTAIGALLTEVFLQLTFTGELPNVGIILLIDHIFNFSYFIIFAILVMVIYTTNLLDKKEELEDEIDDISDSTEKAAAEEAIEALQVKIDKIDRYSLLGLSGAFVIGVFVITLAVRGYIWV